jgi:alpha-glucosidase (family GH31 glycosyl hydrolase)
VPRRRRKADSGRLVEDTCSPDAPPKPPKPPDAPKPPKPVADRGAQDAEHRASKRLPIMTRSARRPILATLLVAAAACALAAPASHASPKPPRTATVTDGLARFQVLSPTLIRLEYAADGRFEDRPTFNAVARHLPVPAYTTTITGGTRVIRTARLTLRWQRGSGPFTPATLSIDVQGTTQTAHPAFRAPGQPYTLQAPTTPTQLGGWRRGLDGQAGPTALGDGLLTRDGWYLLDDSTTAIYDHGRLTPRPQRAQPYQDGYFFGYGHDYVAGLRDLHDLTGAAPLLPRWAFGVWFSDYHPFTDADYRRSLLPAFRQHHVPLDGLVVDTDWKSPNSWNGWEWNRTLFPDPRAFLAWAKGQGLHVVLNVHPSIGPNDPRLAAAQKQAKGKLKQGIPCFAPDGNPCYAFDFGDPDQAAAYFGLHQPFDAQGIAAWWLDWCCDSSSVSTPGVTPDTWINALYAADTTTPQHRGFAFSRIGSAYTGYTVSALGYPSGPWAEHRYTLHFTGDTAGTWPMLAFEAQFTAAEGSIGLPYVTHDIGSYYIPHLPDDLYVRWVQLGTFQPVLRLHSDNGDRLPWQYTADAERSAERFLRLREALLPYTYATARQAHDTGLPMARALYLGWPDQPPAYSSPTEYMYGDSLLVAPVTLPGTSVTSTVWLPPGRWTDWFTGRSYVGPANVAVTSGLDTMPLFVRAGGIVTQANGSSSTGAGAPLREVLLTVAPGHGNASLYEDSGDGDGYLHGVTRNTPLSVRTDRRGTVITIGRARGGYRGAVTRRAWTVQLLTPARPREVLVDGVRFTGWRYDATGHRLVVPLGTRPVDVPVVVTVR